MRVIQFKNIIAAAALTITLAALSACGGGGGDSVAGGGVGGSGVTVASVGTVTGFGSVIVNGVTYTTQGAEVLVENAPAGSGDEALARNLSTGMVVRVEGVLNADGSAAARRVYFNKDLKGPVESLTDLDAFTKEVILLGQAVVLDPFSVLRNTTAAGVSTGMVLEVSGYADEAGRIQATYVNKIADSLPAGGSVEIKGLVQNVDSPSKTCQINALTIDFSSAVLSGLPAGSPQAGQLLKATGRRQPANLLIADRLEPAEEFGSGEFETAELEGIITRTGGASEFAIGRYTVLTDATTSYRNLSPQDLNRGTRVIVRGALTGKSILADEISLFEKIKIESNADTVFPAGNRLVLSGLGSIDVLATATTRIIGTAAGLDEIQPGDHVRLAGRRGSGGEIFASSLLVTPFKQNVELAGPVDLVTSPELVVLGVTIDTSTIPADRFRGSGGKPVSPADFLGLVKAGDIVAAEGNLQSGTITWTAIELE
jgi:hypothetical protein